MIGMGMRNEHRVDRIQLGWYRGRPVPAERAKARRQDGISQDPYPVELHQDGRVADIRQPESPRHRSQTER